MQSCVLITNDPALREQVQRNISMINYTMYLSDVSTLLLDVYRYNIKFVIVDLDCLDPAFITAVMELRDFGYLPVLGLTAENSWERFPQLFGLDHIVPKKHLDRYLGPLCLNLGRFKLQYDRLRNAYESIDSINSSLDSWVSAFFRNNAAYDDQMVGSVLSSTYGVLDNKPERIIVAYRFNGTQYLDIYRMSMGGEDRLPRIEAMYRLYNEDINLLEFGHEIFYNLGDENISDIDDISSVFPPALLQALGEIRNFAGFSTTDFSCLGVDFEQPVTHADAIVLKSMCIGLNLLKGIYQGISEMNSAVLYTIDALARAGEANDQDTGNHLKRVNAYSRFIAEQMGMDGEFIDKISYCAQLHDVGKIHIPITLLNKRGTLSDYEFEMIKSHTIYGAMIIGEAPYLAMARQIALAHHEKYDGSGYPYGIGGDTIPLAARIVAMADIYDALRSPRSYKPPYTHEESRRIITIGDGRVSPAHFDPGVLQVFIDHHRRLENIYEELD